MVQVFLEEMFSYQANKMIFVVYLLQDQLVKVRELHVAETHRVRIAIVLETQPVQLMLLLLTLQLLNQVSTPVTSKLGRLQLRMELD